MSRHPSSKTTPTCGCGRPIRDNSQLCAKCLRWLEQDLAEIPGLLAELATSKYGQGRAGENIGVTSRSAELPLPFNDKPVERARELQRVLLDVAQIVVAGRGAGWPRDTPADLSRFLLTHLGWLRRREEAGDVHRKVTHAMSRLRGAIDPRRTEKRSWGLCGSVEYDEHTGQPAAGSVPCPAEVRAWRNARRAVCTACGTSHELNEERRLWLLEVARGELMYVAQLSQTLEVLGEHVADPTIRSWVSRGRLEEHSRDSQGRALYLVGDVIDLARAEAVRQAEAVSKPRTRKAG